MKNKKTATPGRPEGEGSSEMLARMNKEHKPLRDWGFSFLDWQPEMRILDIGCGGGGTITDMLTLSENSRIDGIDYSPDSVRCATQNNADQIGSRVFIFEGDVSALPFDSDTYDLLTAVETVYFWPDLYRSLKELYRVLKPGGKAAVFCEIDCPDKAAVWGDIHCTLRVYYPWQLADCLKDAGFSDAEYHVKENGYTVVIGTK